jgi:hypothetical protein
MNQNSLIVATQNQVSANLSDEIVILNLTSGIYYGLDPLGAKIWDMVQQPSSVPAILEAVLAEYDVAADRCETDILALLEQLQEAGLIEEANAPVA